MSCPILTTERLILREQVLDDFPAWRDFLASPRSGFPGDEDDAWLEFCSEVAAWSLQGFGAWSVTRHDGTLVGQVSITQPPRYPEPELGWNIYEPHEGNGYATEAAMAVRDWAFGPGALVNLVSYVSADNAASQAVVRKLGATVDSKAKRVGDFDPETLVFRHIAPSSKGVSA